jgi:GAF domain-containing protein
MLSNFIPKSLYPDPYDRQQAVGLFWSTVVVSIALAIALVTRLAARDGEPFGFLYVLDLTIPVDSIADLAYILSFISAFTVAGLVQRGQLELARTLMVVAIYINTMLLYVQYPPNSLFVLHLILPPLAARLLMDRRAFVTVAVWTAVVFMSNTLLHALGVVSTTAISLEPFTTLVFTTLIWGFSMVMLLIFAGAPKFLARQNQLLTAELRTESDILMHLLSSTSVDEMVVNALDLIRVRLGFSTVRVFLVEERTGIIVQRSDRGGEDRRIAPTEGTIINMVIEDGETRVLTRSDELLPAMRTQVLVPMRIRREVIGVLDVQTPDDDTFDSASLQALTTIAAAVGVAAQSLRLAEDVRLLTAERHELAEQLESLRHDYDRVIQASNQQAWRQYLRGRNQSIIGFDYERGIVFPSSDSSDTLLLPLPSADTPVDEPRVVQRDGRDVLTVPITLRGQQLGVMEFRAGNGQVWDSRSIDLVRTIAQRFSIALENIRLYEQAQQAAAREQIANVVAARLQTETDLSNLIAAATDVFQSEVGAAGVKIRFGMINGAE